MIRERGEKLLREQGFTEVEEPVTARLGHRCVRVRSGHGTAVLRFELVAGRDFDRAVEDLRTGRLPEKLPRLAHVSVTGAGAAAALAGWLAVGHQLDTVEGLSAVLGVPQWRSAPDEAARRGDALVSMMGPSLDAQENWERVRTKLVPPAEWDELMGVSQ